MDKFCTINNIVESIVILLCISSGSGGMLLTSLFVWFLLLCSHIFVGGIKEGRFIIETDKARQNEVPSDDVQRTVNLMED